MPKSATQSAPAAQSAGRDWEAESIERQYANGLDETFGSWRSLSARYSVLVREGRIPTHRGV